MGTYIWKLSDWTYFHKQNLMNERYFEILRDEVIHALALQFLEALNPTSPYVSMVPKR